MSTPREPASSGEPAASFRMRDMAAGDDRGWRAERRETGARRRRSPDAWHVALRGSTRVQSVCDDDQPAGIREIAGAMRDRTGNLPTFPAIFPDYAAPIVRNQPEGRELTLARWACPRRSLR